MEHLSPLYRKAELKDIPSISEFIVKCLPELDLVESFPQDLPKITNALKENVEKGAVIIYEECGIIKGVLALGLASFWWSEKPFVTNTCFYVDREVRSKRVADRLIKMAKEFSKRVEIPLVLNFTDNTSDLNRKSKFIQRKTGLKEIGITLA